MKFELKINIDSGNQDVVDFPKETAKKAINRAYKEVQLMSFVSGESSVHATISDANGNNIGAAYINVDMEDEDND